jgi:Fe-Mn family superoxide dismutase
MTDRLKLPDLPYEMKALEPHISERTLEFHYGKHHAAYVKKTSDAVEGTPLEKQPLVNIVRAAAKDKEQAGLFNNAAQAWNHTFFWHCMTPKGGHEPSGELGKRISGDFGSFDAFCEKFEEAAVGQFGSGWAWLVEDGGKLDIVTTSNADTPLVHGETPLLTLDVWEHAYYLDYQNRRPDFVKAFLEHLVNWDFVEQNLVSGDIEEKLRAVG